MTATKTKLLITKTTAKQNKLQEIKLNQNRKSHQPTAINLNFRMQFNFKQTPNN